MSGDPLRDAFRTKLAAIKTSASIAWDIIDTVNTSEDPDVSAPYIDLEFPGSTPEQQASWGNPGNNWQNEEGQVTVKVHTPLGRNQDIAETYAKAIRDGFGMARLTMAGGQQIRITATSSMGGGQDDGGMWVEAVALSYQTYNRR